MTKLNTQCGLREGVYEIAGAPDNCGSFVDFSGIVSPKFGRHNITF